MTEQKPLSTRAAARLAAGETDGAGTNVCARCGGPKPPARINSDRCTACNKPGAAVEIIAERVVLRVPSEVMAGVRAAIAETGETEIAYMQRALERVVRRDARTRPEAPR